MDHPLTLIVLLPLLGFLLNGLAGNRLGKTFVSVVGCGLPILAFAQAVRCGLELQAGSGAPLIDAPYTWANIGGMAFEVAFYFDRLSTVMVLIVTGVGSLIHIYSIGYMKEDASYARYFAYLNLFLFFMLLLVLGRSLLVLFVGWEGVGLASYLLIGFWFEDAAKARAGKKAFIINRIGDVGFLLGMFLLYQTLGTLNMDAHQRAPSTAPLLPAVSASLVGLLLFIGATGKSAQIPLHVWLPDAMAGPTPVSALIHAATMVTAGVYMVARLSGIYAACARGAARSSPPSAWRPRSSPRPIAVAQNDIKKVLAYSTISQLGFMFVAARGRRLRRGDLPSLHARLLQGLPVPRRGQRYPRARRRAGHPQDGRARTAHAGDLRDLRRGHRRHRRHPAARRASSPRTRSSGTRWRATPAARCCSGPWPPGRR